MLRVYAMGYKCAAYGCNSGYATNKSNESVSFHAFPKDPELRDKWIRAISRQDYVPTKYSRICSRHFHDTDFVELRTDMNKSRLKGKSCVRVQPLLRDDASVDVSERAVVLVEASQ